MKLMRPDESPRQAGREKQDLSFAVPAAEGAFGRVIGGYHRVLDNKFNVRSLQCSNDCRVVFKLTGVTFSCPVDAPDSIKSPIERFRIEEIGVHDFDPRKSINSEIFEYIEDFYNTHRRHSTLGNVSPDTVRA